MLALIIIVTERLRQSQSGSGEVDLGVSLASVWCCPLWTSLYHLIIGCSHRTFSSKIINQYFYFLCCFSPRWALPLNLPLFPQPDRMHSESLQDQFKYCCLWEAFSDFLQETRPLFHLHSHTGEENFLARMHSFFW